MAKEVNFIEGPWVPNPSTMFVRRPDGSAIASVYGNDPHCLADKCGKARTHLIAAAPDLLKVVEAVRQACLIADDEGISVTSDPHISEDLFSDITAALAAAKPERT